MNNMNSVRGISRVAALALLATAGLAGVPSFAAARSVTITRSADPQVTYLRLQRASAVACGSGNRADLAHYRVWQLCYQRTLESAVAQLQEPALLAIHRQRLAGAANSAG